MTTEHRRKLSKLGEEHHTLSLQNNRVTQRYIEWQKKRTHYMILRQSVIPSPTGSWQISMRGSAARALLSSNTKSR